MRKDGDLAVGALRIDVVLEGVEDLLERVLPPRGQVRGLPDVAVRAAAEVGGRVVDFEHVRFDFLAHCYSNRNMEYQCFLLLLLLLV